MVNHLHPDDPGGGASQSTDPAAGTSAATDVSLREYVESRLAGVSSVSAERLARLDAQRTLDQQAQEKFEKNVDTRFAQVNEFRGSLDDLGKQMATRRELEAAVRSFNERDTDIQKQLGDLRSRLDVGPQGLTSIQSRLDLATGVLAGQNEQRAAGRAGVSTTTAIIGAVVGVIVVGLGMLNYSALHKNSPTPTIPLVVTTTPAR